MTSRIYNLLPDGSIELNPGGWKTWDRKKQKAKFDLKTDVGDAQVSTVFLGMDHSHDDGRPVVFETMIFGGHHDMCQWRYYTVAEAALGHTAVCNALKNNEELPE